MVTVDSIDQMRAYRKKAGHEHEEINVDLDAKLVRAERFLDDMEAFG